MFLSSPKERSVLLHIRACKSVIYESGCRLVLKLLHSEIFHSCLKYLKRILDQGCRDFMQLKGRYIVISLLAKIVKPGFVYSVLIDFYKYNANIIPSL